MADLPTPSPQYLDEPPAARPPRREWGTYVAWAVILVCVGLVMAANIIRPRLKPTPKQPIEVAEKGAQDARQGPGIQMLLPGRYAVGVQGILRSMPAGGRDPAGQTKQLLEPLREGAKTPADRLRVAAVVAEVEGKPAALEALDRVGPLPAGGPLAQDEQALRTIYTAGTDAVPADARRGLIDRHGWFGRLALSSDKPPTDPLRRSVMWDARLTAAGGIASILVVGGGGAIGLGLFIIGVIALAKRRVRLAYSAPPAAAGDPAAAGPAAAAPYPQLPAFPPPGYVGYPAYGVRPSPWGPGPMSYSPYGAPPPPPPPYVTPGTPVPPPALPPSLIPLTTGPLGDAAGRTGPFIESFAVYLAAQIGFGLVLRLVVDEPALWMQVAAMLALIPLAVLWPRRRGVSWADLRRGLGWHKGRGLVREAAAGLLGYLGGLPVFAVGVIITLLLNKLAGVDRASHPIELEFGKGWLVNLWLYLLACVWAPLVEETMFRGALFHHMRRGWNWVTSACTVAFIFAAIHPQGWTAIPALGSLAVVFAALREWRGSIVAPVTAHFLNNFTVVTFMILVAG